jgi:chorismate-pyruvate lyase
MPNIFNLIKSGPNSNNWTNIEAIAEQHVVSSALKSWLTETSLLTNKLRNNIADYQFEVLQEYFDEDEKDNSKKIFVREIAMLSSNRPYILGQTKTPEKTLSEHPWINTLGENTLGEALKNIDEAVRSDFSYNCFYIENAELENIGILEIKQSLVWARRSTFSLGNNSLSTVELFLPGIECLSN